MSSRHSNVNSDAVNEKVEEMKLQIASELSANGLQNDDWGDVPSRDCGRIGGQIGGNMVRDMIRIAEQQLADHR